MSGPKPTPAYDRVMRRSIESIVFSHGETQCTSCLMATNGDGYPVVSQSGGRNQTTAARVVWEHANGRVPDDLVVGHRCCNRLCVNIDHLYLCTHKSRSLLTKQTGRARGNAKLQESQVIQISHRVDSGEKIADLAREYGVTARAIANIKHRRSWTDLAR